MTREYKEMHEYQRQYQKKWQKEHLEIHRKASKKWKEQHPEITNAEQQAERHISLAGKSCLVCGTTENLERAHIDYSEELEVLIFCAKHHKLIDKYYRRCD